MYPVSYWPHTHTHIPPDHGPNKGVCDPYTVFTEEKITNWVTGLHRSHVVLFPFFHIINPHRRAHDGNELRGASVKRCLRGLGSIKWAALRVIRIDCMIGDADWSSNTSPNLPSSESKTQRLTFGSFWSEVVEFGLWNPEGRHLIWTAFMIHTRPIE